MAEIVRDYTFFNQCVEALTKDIYPQPPDAGHREWAYEAFEWIMTTAYAGRLGEGDEVLDVGCGQGFMCPTFEDAGFNWTGVTIGADFKEARHFLASLAIDPRKVWEADMTFLPFDANSFDLVFARHVLEHSPFPIITLMEWHRVAKPESWMCLVAPAPHYWLSGGKNHYSLVPKENLEWWLRRSGWEPVHRFTFDNRMLSFLRHLDVLDVQLRSKDLGEILAVGKEIIGRYPQGPVEYRIMCRYAEEVLE